MGSSRSRSTTTARPATSATSSPSSAAAPSRWNSDAAPGWSCHGPPGWSCDAAPGGRGRAAESEVLMRVMAQMAMVMNLDKCIGCHTCTVTCKQTWTNRPGTEYVYFNNVETKPGTGYPNRYEDQEHWKGGWALDRKGRLQLKAGSRLRRLLSIFWNPDPPS